MRLYVRTATISTKYPDLAPSDYFLFQTWKKSCGTKDNELTLVVDDLNREGIDALLDEGCGWSVSIHKETKLNEISFEIVSMLFIITMGNTWDLLKAPRIVGFYIVS